MTTKHTPGPWYAHHGAILGENNDDVCEILMARSDEATQANARLIAAAPDLLAACEKAMIECCDLTGTKAGIALEAAIAKAKGETT